MEYVQVLIGQLIIMFIYLAVGWILRRAGLITGESSKALSNLLLYVILPCVILRAFVKADPSQTIALLTSIGLGAAVLALSMVIAFLIFHKNPIANFGAAFSNAGFMGIPLISAMLGADAVFYISGMVALLNILQWTYGQAVLAGSMQECRPQALVKNPLVVSFLLGLILFFLPISLPLQLESAVDAFAACNAPVAMVILGVLLGNVSLRQLWSNVHAWMVSAVRLLLIPALTVLVLALFSAIPSEMKTAILIAASAPVGSNLAVYVQKQGGNSGDAAAMICLSTILSAVSMPLVLLMSTFFWN
jgi:hypothetical protein